jgi:UDP-N-acetylglucosamine acyltransferase
MAAIDPTARIEAGAVIGQDVSIGPYCVIGPNAVIEDKCRFVAHVHVTGHTTVGSGTVIYPFASLGTPPQSVKYRGGPTRLVIGASCDIREGVTMNIGTEEGGGVTEVGARCFFMVGSHVAHDCRVGNDVIFANNAVIAGHVTIGDHVFLGGQAAVRQFLRIGEGAMIGGLTGLRGDVIPFGYALGSIGSLVGLNIVGMKRRGYSKDDMHRMRRAYNELFSDAGTFAERAAELKKKFAGDPVVGKLVAFVGEAGGRLLLVPERKNGTPSDPGASL